MTGKYLHNWQTKEDMIADFEGYYSKDDLTPEILAKYDHVEVLLASYDYENYSGDAFVLFRNKNDGKLYENHGSHCSCYGLEGQWGEEACDLESLKHRINEGSFGSDNYVGDIFKDALVKVIAELENENAGHQH